MIKKEGITTSSFSKKHAQSLYCKRLSMQFEISISESLIFIVNVKVDRKKPATFVTG